MSCQLSASAFRLQPRPRADPLSRRCETNGATHRGSRVDDAKRTRAVDVEWKGRQPALGRYQLRATSHELRVVVSAFVKARREAPSERY